VAAESIGPGDKHWESLTQVRREFADFINQYWFREISNQEQSKELFLLWSDRLGNRALLDQLSAEAAAVDRILKQQYEQNQEKFQSAQQSEMKKLQESTDRLTNALYWLTGFALVVAILDTQLVRQFAAYGGAWFVHHQWGDEFMMWWPLVALTIAGIGLGYLGLKRRLRALYDKKGGR
jgi:hypothetical protein